ncbi:MAG: bifunctional phosphoribosyl-AMP cyclohydrolase/phosphoribosyl-ATP diphosphatase HisIE [Candidatus Eremiobacteraeota bacterium]|nr:bifunctional phosphoribosyl-AMP cyclohydrolase/phosphoribosyl-ATP diphosphatase HisIE [Candidatus Eremiobacteraeota bacterium]
MATDALNWDERGLMPVVICDARSGELLTLAWANQAALGETLATRRTVLYSRSRARLWRKGESSGNGQHVVAVTTDCDRDALCYHVLPHGPACHTGAASCFQDRLLEPDAPAGDLRRAIEHLRSTIAVRRGSDPEHSYVARLLRDGVDRIGKKIGEEATEVVIAAKNPDDDELIWESADLLFHLLVLLEARGIDPDAVGSHLLQRAKK